MRTSNRSYFSAWGLSMPIAFLLLLFAVPQVAAQKKPDFSGRWELVPEKSQLRPTKWNNLELAVEHHEPALRIVVMLKYPQGPDYSYQIPLTIGGKPASVDMGKNTRVYRSVWLGAKLVIKWNEDGDRTETWTLSGDGRALTIIGSAKLSSGGAETWKYEMVKKQ